MLTTIQIKIPEILSENYHTPREMEQSFYEDIIIGEYQKGQISIREAAKLIGVTYEGFMEWLGKRKISFINATQQELKQDYEQFEQFMEQHTA